MELWLSDLLPRVVGENDEGDPSGDVPWWLNLKRWIVSVEEETQSRVDVVLKDML